MKMRRELALHFLVLSFFLGAASNSLGRDRRFTTIDVPGAESTSCVGINPGGDIVGAYKLEGSLACDPPAPGCRGYLLSGGVFTLIDFPDAIGTNASGITPCGDIVGRYVDADGVSHGFLRREGEFCSIDILGATFTSSTGINPSGDIVGRYDIAGRTHGYLLSREQ